MDAMNESLLKDEIKALKADLEFIKSHPFCSSCFNGVVQVDTRACVDCYKFNGKTCSKTGKQEKPY